MKKFKYFLIGIFSLLGIFQVSAQDQKYDNLTKNGIGIFPSMELSNTPRNLSYVVFCPDLVFSFGDNLIGVGPRLVLSNTSTYSNATIPTSETVNGFGINYRKFLSSSKTKFNVYLYYDIEYYNYSYSGPYNFDFNYPYPYYSNYPESYKTNNYNLITGIGYHLHLNKHLFMSNMLGFGIAMEIGTHIFPGFDTNGNEIDVTNKYSNKYFTGQFKLGVGYIF